jgi:hypothetical protein
VRGTPEFILPSPDEIGQALEDAKEPRRVRDFAYEKVSFVEIIERTKYPLRKSIWSNLRRRGV